MPNDFGFIRGKILPQVGTFRAMGDTFRNPLASVEEQLRVGTLGFLALAEGRADTEPFATGVATEVANTGQLVSARTSSTHQAEITPAAAASTPVRGAPKPRPGGSTLTT